MKTQQSFAPLYPEPSDRNKSMGVYDQIPPDLANSFTFAAGYIKKTDIGKIFIFAQEKP
jgi:hypothetical protein